MDTKGDRNKKQLLEIYAKDRKQQVDAFFYFIGSQVPQKTDKWYNDNNIG